LTHERPHIVVDAAGSAGVGLQVAGECDAKPGGALQQIHFFPRADARK
jgi:hypothetical protein